MLRSRGPALGAVVAGIAASSCCIVPLVLALLGAGGAGLGSVMAPYRPLFLGLTIVLVAFALWMTHRRPRASTAEPGDDCCAAGPTRGRRWPTWLMSIVALGLAALPFAMDRRGAPVTPCTERVELEVSGMTCAACERHVEAALLEVPGVSSSGASYEGERGWACLSTPVTSETLVAAVARACYVAAVISLPEGQENSP